MPMMKKTLPSSRLSRRGQPFEGVFERGGHRAVVFGAGDYHGVGFTDGVAQGFGLVWNAERLDVGVEHGDAVEVEQGGVSAFVGGLIHHVPQQFEVPGFPAERAAYS